MPSRLRSARYVPERGHVVELDFDPPAGHAQQGTRLALILSPLAFNRLGMALVCPVTRGGAFARGIAWTVALTEAGLANDGVVLCNQVRTLDWQVRRVRFIEAVPDALPPIGPSYAKNAMPLYARQRANTIEGGTEEIQKNVIAKQVLGL